MPSRVGGQPMTDTREAAGVVTPAQLAMIDRVLGRLAGRLILDQPAHDDAPVIALELVRCGFTHEDQLLDQLVHTLNAPPKLR